MLFGFLIALVSTFIQWKDGDFSGRSLAVTVAHASIPYVALAIIYMIALVIRGPWKLHKDVQAGLRDALYQVQSLERESGPDIMLQVVSCGCGMRDILRFENRSKNDDAHNVELEDSANIKASSFSGVLPIIRSGTSESIEVEFWQQKDVHENTAALYDYLEKRQQPLSLSVVFENSRRTKFRRNFDVRRHPYIIQVESSISGARETI